MKYDQEMRSLEQICFEEGGLHNELLGNVYCGIGMNKKIECVYQSSNKDHNNLYCCDNPLYQSLRHGDLPEKYN